MPAKALKKFNNMYDDVTSKYTNDETFRIVMKYGENMLKLFPDFFNKETEVIGRISAMRQELILRDHEKTEGIKV
jgi:hypothetical protein